MFCYVQGWLRLTTAELKGAFGLADYLPPEAASLILCYGGTAAAPGKFLRYERWLNIPCPGTGADGDPNLSIEVSQEITAAITRAIWK